MNGETEQQTQGYIAQAGNALKKAGGAVQDNAQFATQKISEGAGSLYDSAGMFLLHSFLSFLNTYKNYLKIGNLLSSASETAKSTGNNIYNKAGDLKNAAVDKSSEMGSAAQDNAGAAKEKAQAFSDQQR